jgi:DNA-binding beta-propeller fold protein YncE
VVSDPIAISVEASPDVRAALHRFGRTEDVRFSPDQRRLALPSFDHNSIAVVDVEIGLHDGGPSVSVTGVVELTAPELDYPHGVDFLDDDTLVVANRNATVGLFRLPSDDTAELQTIGLEPGFELMHGPSAVAMTVGAEDAEILIGHRHRNVLTRHVLRCDASGAFAVTDNSVLLQEWITVVDGAAMSPDGRWLALSNPWHQHVLVYDAITLPHRTDPACVLRGASYPHGVRFGPDGGQLYVADAGSPHVHVHTRVGDSWDGVHYPTRSIRVMDDDVFQQGRSNCREGGPKGVDVDASGRVLAVTSERQPLAFFDVSAPSATGDATGASSGRHDAEDLRHELAVVQAASALVEERVGELAARLSAIERSRSYRLAKQVRDLRASARNWRRSAR